MPNDTDFDTWDTDSESTGSNAGVESELEPLTLNSTVYVIWKGTNPKTEMFNSRRYVLKPDEKTPVPFEAVCLWYGDPRSAANVSAIRNDVDETVTFVPDRDSEIRRLTARYGGDDNVRFPDVEVVDLNGKSLFSVVEDPEGEHVLPAVSTRSESAAKDRKIASLEARLERMETMLMNVDSGQVQHPITNEPLPPNVAAGEKDTGGPGDEAEGGGDLTLADIPSADDQSNKPQGKGKPIK